TTPQVPEEKKEQAKSKCHENEQCYAKAVEAMREALMQVRENVKLPPFDLHVTTTQDYLMERAGLGTEKKAKPLIVAGIVVSVIVVLILGAVAYFYYFDDTSVLDVGPKKRGGKSMK